MKKSAFGRFMIRNQVLFYPKSEANNRKLSIRCPRNPARLPEALAEQYCTDVLSASGVRAPELELPGEREREREETEREETERERDRETERDRDRQVGR
eukprot:128538-Rhodomonas_salina.1